MKKHTLSLILLSTLLFANITFAQQWEGNSNSTDPISRTGNVGIGTSTPATLVQAFSANPIMSISANLQNGDATLRFGHSNQRATYQKTAIISEGINSWGWSKLHFALNADIGSANASISDARMTILHTGNVGIGTTNPQSKLAVNGKITATEVEVTSSGWPDFVFAPGYDLKPLPEVEQYIRTNGHLPELPSAEDVKANGIALGENQALLLQKIEELTLYVIALNKENQALKARVDGLER